MDKMDNICLVSIAFICLFFHGSLLYFTAILGVPMLHSLQDVKDKIMAYKQIIYSSWITSKQATRRVPELQAFNQVMNTFLNVAEADITVYANLNKIGFRLKYFKWISFR